MAQDLVNGGAVLGRGSQDGGQELPGRQREAGGQRVVNLFDAAVRLLQVDCLKGGTPTQQCVPVGGGKGQEQSGRYAHPAPICVQMTWDSHDTAQGPHICLRAVTLSLQHFRSHIVRGATDGPGKGRKGEGLGPA